MLTKKYYSNYYSKGINLKAHIKLVTRLSLIAIHQTTICCCSFLDNKYYNSFIIETYETIGSIKMKDEVKMEILSQLEKNTCDRVFILPLLDELHVLNIYFWVYDAESKTISTYGFIEMLKIISSSDYTKNESRIFENAKLEIIVTN